MLSKYTQIASYPQPFESMMILKKELKNLTKKDLKEWISFAIKTVNIRTINIIKNGLYSSSDLDPNEINRLLTSLQNIKIKNSFFINTK